MHYIHILVNAYCVPGARLILERLVNKTEKSPTAQTNVQIGVKLPIVRSRMKAKNWMP